MVKPIQGALDSLLGISNKPAAGETINNTTSAPPPSAPPVQSPVGSPNTPSTGGPSFLAAAAGTPSSSSLGGKTLIGQ